MERYPVYYVTQVIKFWRPLNLIFWFGVQNIYLLLAEVRVDGGFVTRIAVWTSDMNKIILFTQYRHIQWWMKKKDHSRKKKKKRKSSKTFINKAGVKSIGQTLAKKALPRPDVNIRAIGCCFNLEKCTKPVIKPERIRDCLEKGGKQSPIILELATYI